MGGGGFSMEPDTPLLDDFVLSLARRTHPRVCFVATASGEAPTYVRDFYRAFAPRGCEPSDLSLFERRIADLRAFVLGQDVVYVGGGNTANMLAIWRVHGVDRALRKAWERGAVLGGWSAGANCWFEDSVTDSFGPELRALGGGLGLLPGSFCPHYDGEPERRPTYTRLVRDGAFASGYAADDDSAFHFEGTQLREVVSQREGARGYRVTAEGEEPIEPRLL